MGQNFDVFPGFQKFLAMRNIALYSVRDEVYRKLGTKISKPFITLPCVCAGIII